MLKRLLLLLLPCCSAAAAQSLEQYITWGDNAMRLGDRYGASRFYKEALALDPGPMELQWKYAEACRLSHQYPEAAAYYEKVQRKDTGGRKHPEAQRWLGEMQLSSGDYDAALKTWQKVKQHAKDSTSFNGQRARNAIAGIAFAKRVMQAPEQVTVDHVAMPVNTFDSEFAPSLGPDSVLYFTSLRGNVNDEGEVLDTANYRIGLYRTTLKGATFGAPEQVLLDPAMQRANPAWSGDGKRFFFTGLNADDKRSLYMSTWTNGAFSAPVALGGAITSGNASQAAYALIDGQEQLFFTSDRPGGRGGTDIWVGDLHGTDVVNVREAGTAINTLGNESCPFYDAGQHKLYFSSDFLPGLGGYDNFMVERTASGWTAPVNFGYPLNGPANDLYPTFDLPTMSGWFTSNRAGSFAKKGETCCNDLYRYSYPHAPPAVLKEPPHDSVPMITEAAMKRITSLREKLPIRLYFHNDEPGPRSWDTTIAANYAETYAAYKALVPDYRSAWKDNPNGTAAIDAFFHNDVDHGFAQLNDFIALLEQAMQEGQRIELQVRGFASPLAKSDYNRNLSLRRIQSMVNYLRTVHGGVLGPYLNGTAANGGRLLIRKSPFGEETSAGGVSDQLADLRNSVYGVGASRERRIEIEQVLLSPEPAPQASPTTQDIGHLPQDAPRDVVFTIRNTTARPLGFVDSNASCDCVSARLPEAPIPPFGTGQVVVHFNGHAPAGPLERMVTVVTDGTPPIFQLTITGIIDPAP